MPVMAFGGPNIGRRKGGSMDLHIKTALFIEKHNGDNSLAVRGRI